MFRLLRLQKQARNGRQVARLGTDTKVHNNAGCSSKCLKIVETMKKIVQVTFQERLLHLELE